MSDSIQFIIYIALSRFLFITSEISWSYAYILFFFYMQLMQENKRFIMHLQVFDLIVKNS